MAAGVGSRIPTLAVRIMEGRTKTVGVGTNARRGSHVSWLEMQHRKQILYKKEGKRESAALILLKSTAATITCRQFDLNSTVEGF